MKLIQSLLIVALSTLCFNAIAQWQWIDKEGHKVFSDRAPPPEILDKNIIKRPGGRAQPPQPSQASADPANAVDAPNDAPLPPVPPAGKSNLEKELEAKKKQTQIAEAAKRKAADEQMARAKIENCSRARQAKASLDSGMQIGRVNAAGAREVMDEAARAEEIKRIQGIIGRDCQ
jgi:type IV secretory pathway VirB10-like protein